PDNGGKDLFVHHSDILGTGFKSLEENQRVSYVSAEGQKGPQAKSIQKL
ncbi:MAG TPA: cold shock domain-containing protein, partial [Alcaligenes faecalis]|nr:cold shock domain-containing protein [Alcaligenes faecalis]